MKPFFSCVVAVKGPRPYLDAALASLAGQGLGDDLEVIVQDGDAEPDAGLSDAFNTGFAKARGEWLFWLNADDILLPGALRAVRALAAADAAASWIAGNVAFIDAAGRVLSCAADRGSPLAFKGLPVQVYGPSSFFRRPLLAACGGFDPNLKSCMDSDLWTRFREKGYWYRRLNRYVWGFRRHDGSRTKSDNKPVGEQARQGEEAAAMHRRHGLSMSPACYLRARAIRLFDGSYLRSAFDTLRYRGRRYEAIYGGFA